MKSTLSIQDLSVSNELNQAEMSAVRGGNAIAVVGGNSANVLGGGIFSPTTVVQVGPVVTNTDSSTHLKLNLPQAFNFGGQQLVA
jgi:predicted outer membrane repeat protein